MKIFTVAATAAAVAMLSGCLRLQNANGIAGSGTIVKEDRPVAEFSRVSVCGSGELIVTQGGREALSIEADDNILPWIKTEVRDGTLSIGPKDGADLRASKPMQYNLTVKKLDKVTLSGSLGVRASKLTAEKLEIETSGAGTVAIDALTADELTVRIAGSGDCELAGRGDKQIVHISGSGKYRAGKLEGNSVTLAVSGSGNAVVWAKDTLEVKISGSGQVEYYGRPRVSQEVSGSGRINGLDKP